MRCVSTASGTALSRSAIAAPSPSSWQILSVVNSTHDGDVVAHIGDTGAVPRVDVTEAMVAQYRRDGFLVLHDFLTPAQLQVWRDVVDSAVDERGKQKFHVDTAEDVTNVDFE